MCPIQIPYVGSELVRQFIYCPRVPYFRLILGIRRNMTSKMRRGLQKHEAFQDFLAHWEQRLRKQDDVDSSATIPWQRYLRYLKESKVDVYLEDDHLGVNARVDVVHPIDQDLIVTLHANVVQNDNVHEELSKHFQDCQGKPMYRVIELKFTKLVPEKEPFMSHRLQVALQALLVENCWNACVPVGVIHYLPSHEERSFIITERMKAFLTSQVEELRQMLEEETVPPPTPHEKKCIDCEYWNVCYRG